MSETRQGPDWVCVNPQAAWQARDSMGDFVYQDHLWILGGWFSSYAEPPRDVWSSADGVQWERATESACWKHADLPTSLVFDDGMWMMGGWHNGRLPGASGSNQVWFSRDGANWEQATGNAGWTPRLGAAGVVFDGKMWILGGSEQYFFGTEKSLRNDVWCSSDGKEWKQVTASAPWPSAGGERGAASTTSLTSSSPPVSGPGSSSTAGKRAAIPEVWFPRETAKP